MSSSVWRPIIMKCWAVLLGLNGIINIIIRPLRGASLENNTLFM